MSHEVVLAPLVAADLDEVLELNEFWVPHVSSVTRDELAAIIDQCSLAVVARTSVGVAGFVLVVPPRADYGSPNYRFFSARLADGGPDVGEFRYVDRIAVATTAQGTGVGRRLYRAVLDHAAAEGATEVTCEVNVEPPNPGSQAFHAGMGFVEVGRQWNDGGTTQVQLLARPV